MGGGLDDRPLIDAYVRTGAGDLAALMGRISPQYWSGEVADVLAWLRAINTGRTDPVRFVGVEYYFTGPEAFDAVDAHVAATAPDRLADLRRDLDLVRPAAPTIFEHIGWFTGVADKARYVDAAPTGSRPRRRARPPRPGTADMRWRCTTPARSGRWASPASDASSSTCAAPLRRRCEHGWTPPSAPTAWPIAVPTPPSPAEPRPNGST